MVALLRLLMLTVVAGLVTPWPAAAAASSVGAATTAVAAPYVRLAARIDDPVRNPRRVGRSDRDTSAEPPRSVAADVVRQAAVVRKPDVSGATAAAAPSPSPAEEADNPAPAPASSPEDPPTTGGAAAPPTRARDAASAPRADERQAALAPEEPSPAADNLVAIAFPADGDVLDDRARAQLDRAVADAAADPRFRFQLRAYAHADGASASKARRLSLARALAVRSHLMEIGIAGNRIDVRALGDSADGAPRDRVDVRIVER